MAPLVPARAARAERRRKQNMMETGRGPRSVGVRWLLAIAIALSLVSGGAAGAEVRP
jgi:hypothetical protein